MHATELWATISANLNHEILEVSYTHEKKLYRRVVEDLAANLRKRASIILETPRLVRHELFRPLLQLPNFHVVTQNLMILWLAKTQVPMMTTFLDSLEIKHDGQGSVDAFPEAVDPIKLAKAVTVLYDTFPEEKVTAYLSVLDSVAGVNWPELVPLLKKS